MSDKFLKPVFIEAFDLDDGKQRNTFREKLFANGLVMLGCGWQGMRISPSLNITKEEVHEGMEVIEKVARETRKR